MMRILRIAAPLLALALAVAAYLPGLGGPLMFDDERNLEGLAEVNDLATATAFSLSGHAGPTGRPLSLATFALQADAWPDNTRALLATNMGLHLFNALLVGVLAWLLARTTRYPLDRERAYWLAVGTATIWVLLPLLASSSLFIIQRMTLLSSGFVIAGLCLHVAGQARLEATPRAGLALMTAGAVVGVGLGVLAKENAAVYPLLVLALDRTLHGSLERPLIYRRWRWLVILAPALAVAAYLLWRLASGHGFDHRAFTMEERVLTQGVILWDYLRLMLLPDSRAMGPFHDNVEIYGGLSPMLALAATVLWGLLAALAVAFGRRWPLPAFAVLWFLGAHIIESTWLPLELYYEHRNYLPAVGVVFALVCGLGRLQGTSSRIAAAGLGAYVLVLAVSLLQVTSLWGDPRIAAERWYDRNPDSQRAAQFIANAYAEEGHGGIAARILDEASEHHARDITLRLQALRLNCPFMDEGEARDRLDAINGRAQTATFTGPPDHVMQVLLHIVGQMEAGHCEAVSSGDILTLLDSLQDNPVVASNSGGMAGLYLVRARVARHDGRSSDAVNALLQALEHKPQVNAAEWAVIIAYRTGDRELMAEVADTLERLPGPAGADRASAWQTAVEEAREATEGTEGW
ncbi:hypothetical protein, partial [Aquisalimonas sp.]|uniref:hypothetical protein n=1 Tax=Aquisalimonas sp. TaxID=1872621 RepID=UPI0025BDD317